MAEPREARGRPLRALGLVLGGWIAVRVAVLWPDALPPIASIHPAATAALPGKAALVAASQAKAAVAPSPAASPPRWGDAIPPEPSAVVIASTVPVLSLPLPSSRALPPGSGTLAADTPRHVLALLGLVRFGAPEPAPPGPSRWSGSAWAIVRGRGATGVATPQLGGSQAGARLAYALDERGRLAIAGRVAGAIGTRQQEAALGVEWRPTALPLRIVAEQRIGIAQARGGPSIGIVGGVSDVPLPLGLALDGYVQAGAIARDGGEGYADGALRAGRTVARAGGAALDLGLGAWGAAQRGARRLDVGPSAAVTVPLAGQRVRVSVDWRQRIAGDARPGSGVALSLGADF